MGQDLITYTLVGPRNLSTRRKNKAVKQIERLLNDDDFSDDTWYDSHEELVDHFTIPAHELVDNLFAVWSGQERDVNSRPVKLVHFGEKVKKEKNPQQIVVAGDMSCGDEPDGFGYQTLKWANIFGLFEIFDID